MRIAVVTYYAVTNIGDKILTDTVCWMLQSRGHAVRRVDIQGRYAYRFSGFFGAIERFVVGCIGIGNRIDVKSLRCFYAKRLSRCDAIVFGGGEIIDIGNEVVCRALRVVTEFAVANNLPVFYHAIGVLSYSTVGYENSDLRQALTSSAVKSITVRESVDRFKMAFMRDSDKRILWVCDTAVWCAEAFGVKRKRKHSMIEEGVVGINVIHPDAFRRKGVRRDLVVNFYSALIKSLVARGVKVKVFTNGVPRDYGAAAEVVAHSGLSVPIVSPTRWSGRTFLEMLTGFDSIISSRLHTSICSFSLDIPSVAISWDDKIQYFYNSICAEECCFELTQMLDVDAVIELALRGGEKKDLFNRDLYRQSVLSTPFLNEISVCDDGVG